MSPKWCYNYESGQYEWIEKNGYSYDQNAFVYNWDRSKYDDEEEDD